MYKWMHIIEKILAMCSFFYIVIATCNILVPLNVKEKHFYLWHLILYSKQFKNISTGLSQMFDRM